MQRRIEILLLAINFGRVEASRQAIFVAGNGGDGASGQRAVYQRLEVALRAGRHHTESRKAVGNIYGGACSVQSAEHTVGSARKNDLSMLQALRAAQLDQFREADGGLAVNAGAA